jgi:hypothetical protein
VLLDEQSPMVERLAGQLRGVVVRFDVYQPYMVKLEEASGTIRQLRQEPGSDFGEFVKMQERSADRHGWNLESFLEEPLNRLATYSDIFQVSAMLFPANDSLISAC